VTPYDVYFARNMYSKQYNVDNLHLSVYIYTSYNGCLRNAVVMHNIIQVAEIKYLRTDKGCTRLDQIRN
jgi:hypothetical protein